MYDWVVTTGIPSTIQAHSYVVEGPLLLDEEKEVDFEGGFNCDFSINSSSPTLIQSLTIEGSSGPVTIDNIEIR